MTLPTVIQHDKNIVRKWLREWFGTNRGALWTIASSVAVIIFGSYLIYNNRESKPTTTTPAAVRTLDSMTPGPRSN
jgi:hypothetical protein